jgi:hypothetical protein
MDLVILFDWFTNESMDATPRCRLPSGSSVRCF